jgi:hypothetical protein
VLLLFPLASNSEAIQWDLLIQANVENSPLYSGDRPIVSGIIVDHASKPVPKATVNIKSGSMSIFTTTSQSGEFMAELGKQDRTPGNYIVNISATSQEGKTGIASIQFQIKGEISPVAISLGKLSTTEAKYYQKLYKEYLEDEKVHEKVVQEKALKEKQKEINIKNQLKAIEKFQPGMGIFSGPQYENYVNSLDEEVRDTVVKHLNFTKNLVGEAQVLRNEILENVENGGTAEEAQLAYLEKISTSREMIENLDSYSESLEDNTIKSSEIINGNLTNTNIIKSSEIINGNLTNTDSTESTNEDTSTKTPIKANANGVMVEVEFDNSTFFVNVFL